jgi:penicillin-binding protein 2
MSSMLFDREEQEDRAGFSRRAMLLGAGQVALFGLLAGRLYDLQVIEGEKYALAADDNRINVRVLAPMRGEIRDRFGRVVATNAQKLRVLLTPEAAGDLEVTLGRLARLIRLDEATLEAARRAARRQPAFLPVTVAADVVWADFARVNYYAMHLPGVFTEVGWERRYPLGAVMGHVTGYVGDVAEAELTGEAVLRLPGFQIGKTGIERSEETRLRGEPGSVKVVVEASGRVVRELDRKRPRPGQELILTVDRDLQAKALELLGEETGAIVVMDVSNGDVLALASTPTFDPSVFEGGISRADWASLTADERRPLNHRAVAGRYPPGSTFKVATALAALAAAVDPAETVHCGGAISRGRRRFRCWKRSGHGRMDLHEAIKRSCDVYFYTMGERVGIEAIAAMARRLGLGREFDIAGAAAGVVPDPAWKRAQIGETWYGGETIIAAIGQGYVLATPLQLAVMAARVANGRLALTPRFARVAGEGPPADAAALDIPDDHILRVQDGMRAVVNEPGGTAGRAKLDIDGVEMAGKTGTSQVLSTYGSGRSGGAGRPKQEQDHALFIAYAPADAPRYAVAVVVEHAGGGSRAAAPLAKEIMHHVLGEALLARAVYDGEPLAAPATPAAGAGPPGIARG